MLKILFIAYIYIISVNKFTILQVYCKEKLLIYFFFIYINLLVQHFRENFRKKILINRNMKYLYLFLLSKELLAQFYIVLFFVSYFKENVFTKSLQSFLLL